MTSLERNGDVVCLASYAPLLAKKDYTQWKTDMIFFDNVRICLTPNYYVQKMFSTNQGDLYFDNVIAKDEKDTTLAVSCVQDSRTGDVILKMVNAGNITGTMKINLADFQEIIPDAELTLLSGDPGAENTFENPENIVPVKSVIKVISRFEIAATAMSLTVLRIKTRK